MKQQSVAEPIEVKLIECDEHKYDFHSSNFFEIIYIIEGTGRHIINGCIYNYIPKRIYLLSPNDKHVFEIKTHSKYLLIRFTKECLHFSNKSVGYLSREWVQKAEYMIYHHNRKNGCILEDETDKVFGYQLMENILRETINRRLYYKEIIYQTLLLLLQIILRNLEEKNKDLLPAEKSKGAMDLMDYIHKNIYYPEKLKTINIASEFNFSQTYIGEYFKKATGFSIQKYIADYRLTLLKGRLSLGNMRIMEIADEFGFNNESYLVKLFKKETGMSPLKYRQYHKTVNS